MKNIKLNPTLKKILIRICCVVGSLCAFVIFTNIIAGFRFLGTLAGYQTRIMGDVLAFAVPLLLGWLNLIFIDKPIRRIVTAIYVAAYATVSFLSKAEPSLWRTDENTLILIRLMFVVTASLLPIWLQNKRVERLVTFGRVAIFTAALWLDFAVAMPSLWLGESTTTGIYMGQVPDVAKDPVIKVGASYAFEPEIFWGYGPDSNIKVYVLESDSTGVYKGRIYHRHYRSDYMVDASKRDTIWFCKNGLSYDPNRKTMENVEHIALRYHWQYRVWQQLKKTLGRKEN